MQKTDVINKEYITREEAASLLNITLPTLHRYAQKGIVRIYKFGNRSLLKTEELILAIKENKIIKYGVTSLHLYCKDIFVPLWRTLRIQYLMWLYKCTSCPCIRAGFAFIAPEPISSATVIQIVIQNLFSAPDRFLKIRNFSPRIARVIQTVIHIVIHDFRHLEKFIKFSKSATQIATGRISKLQEVSNSEFLIAGSCKTVIHIVIQN